MKRAGTPKTFGDGFLCSLDGFLCSADGFPWWAAANIWQDGVNFHSSNGIFCCGEANRRSGDGSRRSPDGISYCVGAAKTVIPPISRSKRVNKTVGDGFKTVRGATKTADRPKKTNQGARASSIGAEKTSVVPNQTVGRASICPVPAAKSSSLAARSRQRIDSPSVLENLHDRTTAAFC